MIAIAAYLRCVRESDPDLLECGVVLTPERVADTRRHNACVDGAAAIARRQIERARAGERHRAAARRRLYDRLAYVAAAYPIKSHRPAAVKELARLRERWGEAEWARLTG